jgi:hypothetical protein
MTEAVMRHLGFLKQPSRLEMARAQFSAANGAMHRQEFANAVGYCVKALQWLDGAGNSATVKGLRANIEATKRRANDALANEWGVR